MEYFIFLAIENARKVQSLISYMTANQDIDRSKQKISGFVASN